MRIKAAADDPLERIAVRANLVPLPAAYVLYGMTAGRVVGTAQRLGIFGQLLDGPGTAGRLAEQLSLQVAGTRILCENLAGLGILEQDGHTFSLHKRSRKWLDPASSTYIGTWVDGVPRNRGASPQGMIVYTEGGHMSVQIAPDRPRTKAGADPTPEEAQAALKDYIAYFGTYTIDDATGVVTHRRQASIQPGDTEPFQRAPEFKGDRLILRPPGTKQEIVWERIK